MSMYTYLTAVEPDNPLATLQINPQGTLPYRVGITQEVDWMDDGTTETYSLGGTEYFIVSIEWNVLSTTDVNTIIDFYMDASKGNKMAESFLWNHPTDGYEYVVKFNAPLMWTENMADLWNVPPVELRVLGYHTGLPSNSPSGSPSSSPSASPSGSPSDSPSGSPSSSPSSSPSGSPSDSPSGSPSNSPSEGTPSSSPSSSPSGSPSNSPSEGTPSSSPSGSPSSSPSASPSGA